MSLETALIDHGKLLVENTAALKQVSENQLRLIAGQNAAIEKIEGGKGTTAGKATTKAATDAAAKAAAAAEAAKPPAVVEEAVTGRVVTNDDVKASAVAWIAKLDPAGAADPTKMDMDARKKGAAKMNEILEFFGLAGTKLTGPESKLDADQNKQAKFFIDRWAAGLEVNFSEDYDFDSDPTAGATAAPAEVAYDPLG